MERRIIQTAGFNNIAETREGWMIYNKNDSYIGKSLELYGEYSYKEKLLLKQLLNHGDTIIELGANIGALTIPISKIIGSRGKLFALEPVRLIFQMLCGNLAINSCSNTYCYNVGAANQTIQKSCLNIDYNSKSNYGSVDIKNIPKGTSEIINIIRLDDLLYKELEKLKLIKIDIEGMELEAIKGANQIINTFRPIIYIENDRKDKSKQLIETIAALNYKLYWHLVPLFSIHNFAKNQINIFKEEGSVNMLCIPQEHPISLVDFKEVTDSSYHPIFSNS